MINKKRKSNFIIGKHKYSGTDLENQLQYCSIYQWDNLQERLKNEVIMVQQETKFKDLLLKDMMDKNRTYFINYVKQINLEDSVKYLNS